jgi:GWxTD domain-containing protein
MKKLILGFCLLSIILASCLSQKKSLSAINSVNTKEKSNTDIKRIFVKSINAKYLLEDTTTAQIYVKVDFEGYKNEDLATLDKIFNLQWALVPETGIREKLKSGRLEFVPENIELKESSLYLKFKIEKKPGMQNVIMALDIIDTQNATKFTSDLLMDYGAKRLNSRIAIFDKPTDAYPSFKTHFNVDQTVYFKSFWKNSEMLYLNILKNNSNPALSPMSNTKRDENQDFLVQKSEVLVLDVPYTLKNLGTYAFSYSTDMGPETVAFFVGDERFPRLTLNQDILNTLVYMSTPKEIEIMKSNNDPKAAIDLYLLSLAKGDQNQGKKIISNYHRRVKTANELFSTYKEGWKTDKGMVYIIMGLPQKVQRSRKKEIWMYSSNQGSSDIIFTFQKRNNKFNADHYELVRYPEYASFWYPYVEQWRNGSVQN